MDKLSKEELEMFPDTLKYGSLVQKRNMSEADVEILLYKLFSSNNEELLLIKSLLGSNAKMIEFLDVLAGLTIKIPTHTSIVKTINEIEIWKSLKRKGYTQENIKNLSSSYKISVSKIRLIYEEYEAEFGRSDEDEIK